MRAIPLWQIRDIMQGIRLKGNKAYGWKLTVLGNVKTEIWAIAGIEIPVNLL
jgi:hypothetical protein